MDRHTCIYSIKDLYKLLRCSNYTRFVFTGDLGIFTNGHQDQMEHRVYDPYYSLSEQGVQPVLLNSLTRYNPILRHMHLRLRSRLDQGWALLCT